MAIIKLSGPLIIPLGVKHGLITTERRLKTFENKIWRAIYNSKTRACGAEYVKKGQL